MKREYSIIKICCFCDVPMECTDFKKVDDRIMLKFECRECPDRSEITEITRVESEEYEYPE